MCGHVVRYVLRRELLAAARRREGRVRGSVAFLHASSASYSSAFLCRPGVHISMDSAERLREAGGIRPPAFPVSPSPHLPDLRGRSADYHC